MYLKNTRKTIEQNKNKEDQTMTVKSVIMYRTAEKLSFYYG